LLAHNTTRLSGRRSRLSASTSAGPARMHGATATRNSGTRASEAGARRGSFMTTPHRTLDLVALRVDVPWSAISLRAREVGVDAVAYRDRLTGSELRAYPARHGVANAMHVDLVVGRRSAKMLIPLPAHRAARRPQRRTGGRCRSLADPGIVGSR